GPVVLHLSQQLVQCLLVPVVVGGGRAIVEVPVIVHFVQNLADPVLIAALVASWPAQAVILAAVGAAQIAPVLAAQGLRRLVGGGPSRLIRSLRPVLLIGQHGRAEGRILPGRLKIPLAPGLSLPL